MNVQACSRHAGLMIVAICLMPLPLSAAENSPVAELERLFYTPAQRDQLQATRARGFNDGTRAHPALSGSLDAPPIAPTQFDGMLIRSDGKTTRWIDGKAQTGASGAAEVSGLKPGQIRNNGKVYEPYQVVRPQPVATDEKEPTP